MKINLEMVGRESDARLMLARAAAIQEYAALEQSLCMLLACLLGTPAEYASIIFFRLVNTKSRNLIIEDLFKHKHGAQFAPFRASAIKFINKLDRQRNQIIHWHMAVHISADNEQSFLQPPDFWSQSASTTTISEADLREFSSKCDFISRAIVMFTLVAHHNHPMAERDTWLKIFQQPVTYPSPDTHPLSQVYKSRQTAP